MDLFYKMNLNFVMVTGYQVLVPFAEVIYHTKRSYLIAWKSIKKPSKEVNRISFPLILCKKRMQVWVTSMQLWRCSRCIQKKVLKYLVSTPRALLKLPPKLPLMWLPTCWATELQEMNHACKVLNVLLHYSVCFCNGLFPSNSDLVLYFWTGS